MSIDKHSKSVEVSKENEDSKDKDSFIDKIKNKWIGFKDKSQNDHDSLKTKHESEGKLEDVGSLEEKDKNKLYNPYQWVKQLFYWSNFQVGIVVLATIVVWVMFYKINQRKWVVIDIQPTLEERVFGYYKTNDFERDQLDRFIIMTMSIMRNFDFKGQNNIDLLKGLVNPDILESVQSEYLKNQMRIERNGMVQSLTITNIENVYLEEEVGGDVKNNMFKNARAYIKGYLQIVTFPNGQNQFARIVPYRAQLVLAKMPESEINREGYYLIQISEVQGEDNVKRFDEIAERERRNRE